MIISVLKKLSLLAGHKPFNEMSRQDVLICLNSLKETEEADPSHKWISSYNLHLTVIIRFFKWIYYPELSKNRRKKPAVLENIEYFKRKEESSYKPTDLWTVEDDELFYKYCQNERDACFHALARDSSCRPHEILKLRIKDVIFKTADNGSTYAEVTVNGKTGQRTVPLFRSIKQLTAWLEKHPAKGIDKDSTNPNGLLICSISRQDSFLKPLTANAMWMNYQRYKSLFTRLVNSDQVPEADRKILADLVRKPFNPYIFRHSSLTEKSIMIQNEYVLRQHAGWSKTSKVPARYLHYFGNESSKALLRAYGLIRDERQTEAEKYASKACHVCKEKNSHDAKFCSKCKSPLTYEEFMSQIQRHKQEFEDFKQEIFTQLEKQPRKELSVNVAAEYLDHLDKKDGQHDS